MKKITAIITLTILLTLFTPFIAGAQFSIPKPDTLPGPTFDFQDEGQKEEARTYVTKTLIPNVTKVFIGFAGIAAFIGLVASGIMYMIAYGKDDMIEKAKKLATWSLMGLFIAMFSFAIVSILTQIKIIT